MQITKKMSKHFISYIHVYIQVRFYILQIFFVFRLRDASAHEKHLHQKTQKEAEAHKAEAIELLRTKERLESRVSDLEAQITDLQEQVRLFFTILVAEKVIKCFIS